MKTEFALDLSLARRKSGLMQRDCATLLDLSVSEISRLEAGRRLPTLREIVTLSLIYGRSFESLFADLLQEARAALRERILTLPKDVRHFVGTQSRTHTIEKLARSLADETQDHGG